MIRLIKPQTFVSRAATHEEPARSAADAAAEFLDSLEADGIEPIAVYAFGDDARITLTGGIEPNSWLVFRRSTPPKGKIK